MHEADSLEADVSVDERVEAELGVVALLLLWLWLVEAARSLSIDSEGRVGRCRVGAVDGRS